MVKQYLKNRRENHYANGWLDAPAKYDNLKGNSAKCNPGGSCKKKGLVAAAEAQKRVKKRSNARGWMAKLGKAKKPGIVVDDDEQNENEDGNDSENGIIAE